MYEVRYPVWAFSCLFSLVFRQRPGLPLVQVVTTFYKYVHSNHSLCRHFNFCCASTSKSRCWIFSATFYVPLNFPFLKQNTLTRNFFPTPLPRHPSFITCISHCKVSLLILIVEEFQYFTSCLPDKHMHI